MYVIQISFIYVKVSHNLRIETHQCFLEFLLHDLVLYWNQTNTKFTFSLLIQTNWFQNLSFQIVCQLVILHLVGKILETRKFFVYFVKALPNLNFDFDHKICRRSLQYIGNSFSWTNFWRKECETVIFCAFLFAVFADLRWNWRQLLMGVTTVCWLWGPIITILTFKTNSYKHKIHISQKRNFTKKEI